MFIFSLPLGSLSVLLFLSLFLSYMWPASTLIQSSQSLKLIHGHLRLQTCPSKPSPAFLFQTVLLEHSWGVFCVFHIPDLSLYSGHWHMFHATLIHSLCSIIWHWISFLFDRFPGCSWGKYNLYLRHVFGLLSTYSFRCSPFSHEHMLTAFKIKICHVL